LGSTAEREVEVVFVPYDGTALEAFEKRVKNETGSAKVRSLAPTFTKEKNAVREARILEVMTKGCFSRVASELDFVVRPGALKGLKPRFLVRYRIAPYDERPWSYLDTEAKFPVAERQVFPAVKVL